MINSEARRVLPSFLGIKTRSRDDGVRLGKFFVRVNFFIRKEREDAESISRGDVDVTRVRDERGNFYRLVKIETVYIILDDFSLDSSFSGDGRIEKDGDLAYRLDRDAVCVLFVAVGRVRGDEKSGVLTAGGSVF